MKAVIMAGGQGSRLRPLSCDLPKPMVPIINYPVMEYIIRLLKNHGINEIAVTTYYLPGVIEDYFGSGSKWGVNLHYFVEEEPLGTAGSVHNADQFLDETFLVISGDAITDFDLRQAVNYHQDSQAEATLVLAREDIPLDYGVVITDDEGKIVRFLEKPNWGQVFSDTINTGIYLLEPEVFSLYRKGQKFDFSQDLFPLMLEKGMGLYGVALEGYWNDIGSLEEYQQTQFDFMNGEIELAMPDCRKIGENIWVEDGVKIDEKATLKGPLYIGENSAIAAGVYLDNSVIGKNCYLHPYTSVKNSILWDNNSIGAHSEIRGAILANNIIVEERAAIFDQATIGKRVVIGKESRIKPAVKIWPEKKIEAKVEVESNIIWSTHWSKHLFSNRGVIGQSNIDITPEFVSSLAVAYGSTLKKGNDIIVSSDNYTVSNALKRAFSGGLQAAGVDVVDIGDSTTSVTRYSITQMSAQGGVHIRVSYHDPQKTVIEFLDEKGVNISINRQKGIEKKYFTKEFKRVNIDEIGEYAFAPNMSSNYLEGILTSLNKEEIKRNYFSIVIDYEHDSLGDILPLFLRRLNCQLISTRNYSNHYLPLSLEHRLEASSRVARIMEANNADLGIIIDHNGEELHIVTEQGQAIDKATYQVLISYLLLNKGFKILYLPVNAPMVIETLAEEYGARVEYTRINPQVAMEKFYNNQGDNIFAYYPYTDGIAGLGIILENLASNNINLDQLLNRLPEFYLNNAEIFCDWENKGRVMRYLSTEAGQDTELIDGVKFSHPQGWALVIPDSEKTVFHVYAEGQDMETAESLSGFYLDKIKEIMEK